MSRNQLREIGLNLISFKKDIKKQTFKANQKMVQVTNEIDISRVELHPEVYNNIAQKMEAKT